MANAARCKVYFLDRLHYYKKEAVSHIFETAFILYPYTITYLLMGCYLFLIATGSETPYQPSAKRRTNARATYHNAILS